VNSRPKQFGDGGEPQVGGDGRGGCDSEKQDEDGCHHGASADTGDSDDEPCHNAGQRIAEVDAGEGGYRFGGESDINHVGAPEIGGCPNAI
jgi:hypothetical protein